MKKQEQKSVLKLVKYPDPVLLRPCRPVKKINAGVREFVKEMALFMTTGLKWGVPMGLAAPQVGMDLRIFIALGEVFINPEIVWMTKAPKSVCHEGCYSLDENNFGYRVERASSVRLKWMDLKGNWNERRFNGFNAEVIQHEMDHLDGKLIGTIPNQHENEKETKKADGSDEKEGEAGQAEKE
jgi:peptide deformylase